jgi:hypothetical protein
VVAAGEAWEAARPGTGQLMAQSLNRVRELIGADLDDQVQEATREFDMQTDVAAQGPHLDRQRLRGIPCYAKGVSGVQADSLVPGSDEHLEMMDGEEAA